MKTTEEKPRKSQRSSCRVRLEEDKIEGLSPEAEAIKNNDKEFLLRWLLEPKK